MKTLHYEFKGKMRKQLVDAMAHILAMQSEYLGPPTYAYKVGDYTVNRDGNIEIPDDMDQPNISFIIEELAKEGFVMQPEPETTDDDTSEPDSSSEEDSTSLDFKENSDEDAATSEETIDTDNSPETVEEIFNPADNEESATVEDESVQEDIPEALNDEIIGDASDEIEMLETVTTPAATDNNADRITISIPRDGIDSDCLSRIQAIIASKAPVLKVALETEDLSIIATDNELQFPWFTNHGIDDEAQAYADLISAIVARAKKLTRVTASECARDNDKFVMRLFLVALEMKGGRYKETRRILMRNLKGDGGWRTQEAKDRHDAKVGKIEKTVDVSAVQIIEGGAKNELPEQGADSVCEE